MSTNNTFRFYSLLLGVLYALVYHYIYVNYMYEYFSYMYCPDPAPILKSFGLYVILSAAPLLFYKGFRSLAAGISFFVYILMYVPMIYVTFISKVDSSTEIGLIIILFVFISLSFISDDNILLKKGWNSTKKLPFSVLEITTVLFFIFVVLIEGRSLKFVNILSQSDIMYDMRASYSSSRLAVTGYLISWLKTAFLPVLLVYYLKTKCWNKYGLILFAYLIIFMLDMQKVTFVMPYIISLCYLVAKRTYFSKMIHVYLIGFFSIFSSLVVATINNPLSYSLASIFIMRMQCLDSWIFSLYLDFFKTNPFTYYTHINFVNAITNSYPYKQALGVAVTEGGMNANASFLVTDGYAAMGIPGMIIIGFIFIVLKMIFNSIDIRFDRNFVILTMFPAISAMLNVSLFTAVFSCGFLLLYLIYKHIDLCKLEK